MEKSLRKIIIALLLVLPAFYITAQDISGSIREEIRIRLWSEIDKYPGGKFEDGDLEIKIEGDSESTAKNNEKEDPLAVYRYGINRIRELAPYLMSGMLYGWTFDYTPGDKKRGVSEFFDYELIKKFDKNENSITMHYPIVKDEQLVTWAWCRRTPYQIDLYDNWVSVTNPKIHGSGSASVELGFDGIKEACGRAIKDAVRNYYQQTIKNKPKEISGRVILSKEPRVYIRNGQYTVDLDFFMETDRITLYTFY